MFNFTKICLPVKIKGNIVVSIEDPVFSPPNLKTLLLSSWITFLYSSPDNDKWHTIQGFPATIEVHPESKNTQLQASIVNKHASFLLVPLCKIKIFCVYFDVLCGH